MSCFCDYFVFYEDRTARFQMHEVKIKGNIHTVFIVKPNYRSRRMHVIINQR